MALVHLQLSIMEAQDVHGDWMSPPKYYVKLRTEKSQARTDTLRANSPRFLEDIRLHFCPEEHNSYLEVALWQVGEHGDLVIGTHELLPKDIEFSTEPQWLILTNPEGTETARLSIVIRQLPQSALPNPNQHIDVGLVHSTNSNFVNRNEVKPKGAALTTEATVRNVETNRRKFPFLKATLVSLTTFILGIGHFLLNRSDSGVPFEDPCDIFPSLSQCIDRQSLIASVDVSHKASINT